MKHSIPLYLHLQPVLAQTYATYPIGVAIERGRHQLTQESYERLRRFLVAHIGPRIPAPQSGGAEVVGSKWDSFSNRFHEFREPVHNCQTYEILPFDEQHLWSGPPAIHDELVALEQ